jgi:DNA-binding NarL/FixJ family response regulator
MTNRNYTTLPASHAPPDRRFARRLLALALLRADEGLRLVPVVVLTSSREESDLIASYRLGANAYVVKPVDFHKSVEAVKALGVF